MTDFANAVPLYKLIQQPPERKILVRKVVDFVGPALRDMENMRLLGIEKLKTQHYIPPNRDRTGRRLITGTQGGEITLWHGIQFKFETFITGHNDPVWAVRFANFEKLFLTADYQGIVKFWETSSTNIRTLKAHSAAVRDLVFSPSDLFFGTASDDTKVKIWDTSRCHIVSTFGTHGWDVRSLDWHPSKGLIASGSKDGTVKLWSPRNGKVVTSLESHKSEVSRVRFNKINGNWLLSSSKDERIRLWDIRMMRKESIKVFSGPTSHITAMEWHPVIENIFASATWAGNIQYWETHTSKPAAMVYGAHQMTIWDIAWNPLGHILSSVSNDHSTKFWVRNRPGDDMTDQYNLKSLPERSQKSAIHTLHEAEALKPGNKKKPKVLEDFEPVEEDSLSKPAFEVKDSADLFFPEMKNEITDEAALLGDIVKTEDIGSKLKNVFDTFSSDLKSSSRLPLSAYSFCLDLLRQNRRQHSRQKQQDHLMKGALWKDNPGSSLGLPIPKMQVPQIPGPLGMPIPKPK